MRVLVDVVYALGVERAGPALDAVDLVAFFQKEFGQVRARKAISCTFAQPSLGALRLYASHCIPNPAAKRTAYS